MSDPSNEELQKLEKAKKDRDDELEVIREADRQIISLSNGAEEYEESMKEHLRLAEHHQDEAEKSRERMECQKRQLASWRSIKEKSKTSLKYLETVVARCERDLVSNGEQETPAGAVTSNDEAKIEADMETQEAPAGAVTSNEGAKIEADMSMIEKEHTVGDFLLGDVVGSKKGEKASEYLVAKKRKQEIMKILKEEPGKDYDTDLKKLNKIIDKVEIGRTFEEDGNKELLTKNFKISPPFFTARGGYGYVNSMITANNQSGSSGQVTVKGTKSKGTVLSGQSLEFKFLRSHLTTLLHKKKPLEIVVLLDKMQYIWSVPLFKFCDVVQYKLSYERSTHDEDLFKLDVISQKDGLIARTAHRVAFNGTKATSKTLASGEKTIHFSAKKAVGQRLLYLGFSGSPEEYVDRNQAINSTL